MDWFYAKNNQQLGPVPFQVLSGMLQRGELQGGDLVWRDGMPAWIPASSAPELMAAIPTIPGSIGYYNPIAGGYGAADQIDYAGFWLRWVAAVIDGLLLGVVGLVINFGIGVQGPFFNVPGRGPQFYALGLVGLRSSLGWIIGWLYNALMESSSLQGSLGKLALGITVTDMQGQRISFGRATGRYWGKIISTITIYIGYMMAGWTEKKQALHDIMAECLVIRRR
jgi:uncharacterized RDD family membrane protein YckC